MLVKGATGDEYIDGLLQKRSNSISNALELRLSCTITINMDQRTRASLLHVQHQAIN